MKVFKKISVFILMTVIAATSMLCLSTNTASAAGKTYNVMIINFDPTFKIKHDNVTELIKQHELASYKNDPANKVADWNNPYTLADQFAKEMSEVSYGNVNYKIAEKIELNEMPRSTKIKKAPYTTDEYYKTLMTAIKNNGSAFWEYDGWKNYEFSFDYDYYLKKYKVYDKVNSGKIDEVWIFAGPMVGVKLHETIMVGKNAFWVNGEPLKKDCKNFIVYGFNYERGVGEMLEDAGHRQESIMDNVFGAPNYKKDYSKYNDWEKFTAYECVAKGKSGVGNVHHAPNSLTSSINDHDWQRTNRVLSYCDTWYNYPDLSGTAKTIGRDEWGGDDNYQYILKHHKWWFKHMPHANGKNVKTGFYTNWWTYFSLDYINCPPAVKYHIGTCSFSSVKDATYTGNYIRPSVTVKHGSKTLKQGTDYTVYYTSNLNAGTATMTITGIGNYTGKKVIKFRIQPRDISTLSYSSIPDQKYTGKAITPALTVKYGSITLKRGTDYTYNPGCNTDKGKAIIMLFGRGNYTGSKSVFFNIV